ncbi:MAG: leucine-rich repeat protein [Bacteroidales bacterium]|nr:leucine-rich repeat protein [Bacteroidales bacterium]MBQ7820229.1 leucine-rich repeat protein [Bacteroidales bacterium]
MKKLFLFFLIFVGYSVDSVSICFDIDDVVTEIRRGEYAYDKDISVLNIPPSVTKIDNSAFAYCKNLRKIYISESVRFISPSAFVGCTNIDTIIVSEANSIYDSRNNCNAIIETKSNTIILGANGTVIPNSITTIGEGAFKEYDNIQKIYIPESVRYISPSAYVGCTNIDTIIVSEANPIYDSRNNCNAIVETESNMIILGCKNTIIPDSVSSIGVNAFSGSSICTITFPPSLKEIKRHAFSNCVSLSDIKISSSLKYIGSYAFNNCVSLTKVDIPRSVKSIGFYPFLGCSDIEIISNKFKWRDRENHKVKSIDDRTIKEKRGDITYNIFFADSTNNEIDNIFARYKEESLIAHRNSSKAVLFPEIYKNNDSLLYMIRDSLRVFVQRHFPKHKLYNREGESIVKYISVDLYPCSGKIYLDYIWFDGDAYDLPLKDEIKSFAQSITKEIVIPIRKKMIDKKMCYIRSIILPFKLSDR